MTIFSKHLHPQVVFYFLKLVNFKDFINGYTALHWAAKHGNIEIIKLLAGKHQADVNIKSHGGYTALHIACQQGHHDIFDILVEKFEADQNIRDNAGKKPRQYLQLTLNIQPNFDSQQRIPATLDLDYVFATQLGIKL